MRHLQRLLIVGFPLALAGAWLVGCACQSSPELPVAAGTPVPSPREPITVENADQLMELAVWTKAEWGKGLVRGVAFSPRGHLLAVGTARTIRLYDSRTLELVRSISTDSSVVDLAFGSDTSTLIARLGHCQLATWDPETGDLLSRQRLELEPYVCPVEVDFSQDGSVMAGRFGYVAGTDRSAYGDADVWSTKDGNRLLVVQSAVDSQALSISSDGSLLALAGSEGDVEVWDVGTGELYTTLTTASPVQETALLADDSLLVAGPQSLQRWDAQTGDLLWVTDLDSSWVSGLTVSPQDDLVAVCIDGVVRLFETVSGEDRQGERVFNCARDYLAFSPDDGILVSSDGRDGNVSLWDPATGESREMLQGFTEDGQSSSSVGTYSDLVISTDGQAYVYMPNVFGLNIDIRNLESGQVVRTIKGLDVTNLSVSADGRTLAAGARHSSQRIYVWDVGADQPPRRWQAEGDLTIVALSPDGRMEAHNFPCARSRAVLRDFETEKTTTISVHSDDCSAGCPNGLLFSPDSSLLAIRHCGIVTIVDTRTATKSAKLDIGGTTHSEAVAFSPDGRILAADDDKGTVWLVEPVTGEVIDALEGHTDRVGSMAFSPDGKLLSVGLETWPPEDESPEGRESSIWLWDVETGSRLHVLEEYTADVFRVAFSADGTLLVSGSWRDGTVRLWGVVL